MKRYIKSSNEYEIYVPYNATPFRVGDEVCVTFDSGEPSVCGTIDHYDDIDETLYISDINTGEISSVWLGEGAKVELADLLLQQGGVEAHAPFKHSFMESRKTRQEIKDFLRSTKKPIKYTYGYKYRHPVTYMVPLTLDQALKKVDTESLLDIEEYPDYIDMNAYSSNDMW